MESDIQDDYEHGDHSVFYSPVNIPGPGIDADLLFGEQFQGCTCTDSCKACSCVNHECHSGCSCSSDCPNRLVQKGPHNQLELIDAGSKGFGLRCRVDLVKGDFVCEYAGEVIGPEEARKRFREREGKSNYIFALREHFGNGSPVTTYIDPTFIGNIGRYVNHSCDPNLLVVPVRTDIVVPKLCLFAKRDIPASTELTFDYGGGCDSVGGSVCHCGASNCRRLLPFDSSLN